jgi:hypothetical protein
MTSRRHLKKCQLIVVRVFSLPTKCDSQRGKTHVCKLQDFSTSVRMLGKNKPRCSTEKVGAHCQSPTHDRSTNNRLHYKPHNKIMCQDKKKERQRNKSHITTIHSINHSISRPSRAHAKISEYRVQVQFSKPPPCGRAVSRLCDRLLIDFNHSRPRICLRNEVLVGRVVLMLSYVRLFVVGFRVGRR